MILVPTDFTSVADCALNHALKLASILKVSIGLLHIVENDKHKDDALEKLKQIIEINSEKSFMNEAKRRWTAYAFKPADKARRLRTLNFEDLEPYYEQ